MGGMNVPPPKLLGTRRRARLPAAMPAQAQSVADFYRGKTVNCLIGVGVGGEYDLQARLVARHIGKHIPGNPTVVPQNMPGAGGSRWRTTSTTQAPRDGTDIGMIGNSFPAIQALGGQACKFDASQFNWLGTIAPVVETMAVWHTAGSNRRRSRRKRETVAGATGRGAITYIYPPLMNEFLGTKFKIVTGYPGGNEINLAMERGEVQARNNTWSSWKATKPAWVKDKQIHVMAQAGAAAPDLDAPSVEDLAARRMTARYRTDRVGHAARPSVRDHAGRAGGPARRAARRVRATMKDPEFLKDARKLNFEVDPVRGSRCSAWSRRSSPRRRDDRRPGRGCLE